MYRIITCKSGKDQNYQKSELISDQSKVNWKNWLF